MKSVNKVLLMGHLATDPEVKMTQKGDSVATFHIATNRGWTAPNGEKKEAADFHKIVAWKKLGEVCGEYLKKGSSVYLEGRIANRSYKDKEGKERKTTEIVADLVNFIRYRKHKDTDEVNLVDLSPAVTKEAGE